MGYIYAAVFVVVGFTLGSILALSAVIHWEDAHRGRSGWPGLAWAFILSCGLLQLDAYLLGNFWFSGAFMAGVVFLSALYGMERRRERRGEEAR